jgi:hypothetical protein
VIRTFDEELQEGNAESKHRRTQSKNTLVRDKREDVLVRVGNKLHSKVNLPMRGGKVSVVCHDHRNEPKLCTCTGGNKSLSNKIVQCSYCQMGYHYNCIGVTLKEIREQGFYACEKCKKWGDKRMSLLSKALTEGEHNEILVPKTH